MAEQIIGQLQNYKKTAPFFNEVVSLVEDCLDPRENSLSMLNVKCLESVCAYLEIPFQPMFFSELRLTLGPVEGPGDWALQLSEALGASEYINPPGGVQIYDRSKFESAGIKLTIQPPVDFVYECKGYQFEPNLSIIDVLMWNSPDTVRTYFRSRSSEW